MLQFNYLVHLIKVMIWISIPIIVLHLIGNSLALFVFFMCCIVYLPLTKYGVWTNKYMQRETRVHNTVGRWETRVHRAVGRCSL